MSLDLKPSIIAVIVSSWGLQIIASAVPYWQKFHILRLQLGTTFIRCYWITEIKSSNKHKLNLVPFLISLFLVEKIQYYYK